MTSTAPPSSPRLSANGGAAAVPVSVGKVLGRGIFVVDGALYDAQGQRAAKVMDAGRRAAPSRRAQLAECALAYAAAQVFVKDTRAIAAAIASFPGLAHRMEEVGRIGKTALHQRFQGHQRRCHGAGAGLLSRYFLDRGRQAQGRRHREPGATIFPRIRKAYLIGEAADAFARTLDGKAPYRNSRHTRRGGGSGRRRCRAFRRAGAGGAAVAGLRLLRPVQGFRAARRCLPRPGGEAAATTVRAAS